MTTQGPIRIANCSGFYGDRLSAAKEQVTGGDIDVLTGDWLAELTMLILFKDKMTDPKRGFAKTFLKQMEDVLGTCLEKGIKVLTNAGGLNPKGLAAALGEAAAKLGISPKIAVVLGDDVTSQIGAWQKEGLELKHADTGLPLKQAKGMPLAANAYLGCWGLVKALELGADVVITGRTTDAALVMAPAAWRFGWSPTDYSPLSGALVAGHVIECGAQATGGNYSFWQEVQNYHNVGFPIAEVYADGSSVITKHPGTGGVVTVDSIKAQLLYEIQSLDYHSPDCLARLDTLHVEQEAPDRVRIKDMQGGPPTDLLKVGVNLAAGYRNSAKFVVGGADPLAKAKLLEDVFWPLVGGKQNFAETRMDVLQAFVEDPPTPNHNLTFVTLGARDLDQRKVDRIFGQRAIELALSTLPGLSLGSLPEKAQACGVFFPTLVPRDKISMTVEMGGETHGVEHPVRTGEPVASPHRVLAPSPVPTGRVRRLPLGRVAGSRSGDKGGNANVGFWVRKAEHYPWLRNLLTVEQMKKWLAPSGFTGEIERYELPNLWALNFILKGYLGDGVGASLAPDPQAKCLGEFFRAKMVDVDEVLL